MMKWLKTRITLQSPRPGFHDITAKVQEALSRLGAREGLCHLFLQHTSASLAVSESYDPSARQDLEEFLRRMAPENEPWYRHTLEGPDDSPSHLRSLLTGNHLSLPVDEGKLNLGTWQGIYLCEHRRSPQARTLLIRVLEAGD